MIINKIKGQELKIKKFIKKCHLSNDLYRFGDPEAKPVNSFTCEFLNIFRCVSAYRYNSAPETYKSIKKKKCV